MFGWIARLFRRREAPPLVHVEPVFEPVPPPPEPFAWRLIGVCPVGGLRSLGFQPASDVLLIVSEGGRIVIDALTSLQLARDPMRYLVGQERCQALGIGPLRGQVIEVAGLYGGQLPEMTADGWRMMGAGARLIAVSPGGTAYDLHAPENTLVAGFSPTGATFVIGDPAEVAVYGRIGA